MWSYLGISICILMAVVAGRQYRKRCEAQLRFASAHQCYPPRMYPHRTFLLRLDLFFEIARDILSRRFTEGVRERFSRYGPTFTAHLAYRRVVCTIEPSNLECLMRTNFDDYTIIKDRQKLIRLVFGDGVFSTTGKDWKHSREMIRGAMARADLSVQMFDKHVQRSIDAMKGEKGRELDMASRVLSYTMAASSEIIFGDDPTAAKGRFNTDFAVYGDMAVKMTLWVDPIPFVGQLLFGRKFNQLKRAVRGYVDGIIHSAAQAVQTPKAGHENLVKGMFRHEPNPDRIRGESLNVLLAGRDTVGTGIIELFYLLARHPVVWQTLRSEAAIARVSSMSDLKSLRYLRNVVNEGLRLRPALAVHAKKAIRDTVLPRGGGDGSKPLFVPKGCFVLYSNYALHRNAHIFGDDVDDFNPSRWETISPARYEYLSFGAGPRHCPGKEMGWAMVALFTLRMAQEFETLRPADDKAWVEAWSFTLGNKHGLHVYLS